MQVLQRLGRSTLQKVVDGGDDDEATALDSQTTDLHRMSTHGLADQGFIIDDAHQRLFCIAGAHKLTRICLRDVVAQVDGKGAGDAAKERRHVRQKTHVDTRVPAHLFFLGVANEIIGH